MIFLKRVNAEKRKKVGPILTHIVIHLWCWVVGSSFVQVHAPQTARTYLHITGPVCCYPLEQPRSRQQYHRS
jgi:hypothetical protein